MMSRCQGSPDLRLRGTELTKLRGFLTAKRRHTNHRFEGEVNAFLEWFKRPEPESNLRKLAVAHLWFVTIHFYDDGNGRMARAITDLALWRCDNTDTSHYSISAEIMRQRGRYCRAQELTEHALELSRGSP